MTNFAKIALLRPVKWWLCDIVISNVVRNLHNKA